MQNLTFKHSAVYLVQCKTFAIARELANDFRNCTPIECSQQPPYCLRKVNPYRDRLCREFRKVVCKEVLKRRGVKQ